MGESGNWAGDPYQRKHLAVLDSKMAFVDAAARVAFLVQAEKDVFAKVKRRDVAYDEIVGTAIDQRPHQGHWQWI